MPQPLLCLGASTNRSELLGKLQEARLGRVIDRFYEAAAHPELWRTVLHETSLALGAEGSVILAYPDVGLGLIQSEGVDELLDRFVRGQWHNIRGARGLAHSPWKLQSEATLFRPEELDRLPFYTEFLGPLGFRWFAGARLAKSNGNTIILSVERKARDEAFSRGELAAIDRILPHLRRASEMAMRFGLVRAEGRLDALATMKCGGILIDFLGRVIRTNDIAQRHIGRGLTGVHGQLTSPCSDANAALQRLIGSVLQPGPSHEAAPRGAVAVPRSKGRPLIIHAAPIVGSARDIFQQAKAILMLVDPDEHRQPAEPILQQVFGLTPAEASIAASLAEGQDLQEIASERGVSLGTVRNHLKAVFAKTKTHRQSELVSLLGHISVAPE